MKVLSIFATLLAVVNADISLSRTFDKVAPGNKLMLLLSPGCATTDEYGSNDCDFKWGQKLDASVNGTLAQDLTSTAKFTVDAKVDKIIPLKFSCAMCGQNCSFEIPIVKQAVSFPMPPCPIQKENIAQSFSVTLPATSPVPITVNVEGSVTVNDGSADIVVVSLTGSLKKESSTAAFTSKLATKFAKSKFLNRFGKTDPVQKFTTRAAQEFQKMIAARKERAQFVKRAAAVSKSKHTAQHYQHRHQAAWKKFASSLGEHKNPIGVATNAETIQTPPKHAGQFNVFTRATAVEGIRRVHN